MAYEWHIQINSVKGRQSLSCIYDLLIDISTTRMINYSPGSRRFSNSKLFLQSMETVRTDIAHYESQIWLLRYIYTHQQLNLVFWRRHSYRYTNKNTDKTSKGSGGRVCVLQDPKWFCYRKPHTRHDSHWFRLRWKSVASTASTKAWST